MDYLLSMNREHINVGDLVQWDLIDPPVLGLVVGIFDHGYMGIDVLWFGEGGENVVSPCRPQDVTVLSRAKKEGTKE